MNIIIIIMGIGKADACTLLQHTNWTTLIGQLSHECRSNLLGILSPCFSSCHHCHQLLSLCLCSCHRPSDSCLS